jgi:hypothetical protein
MADQTSIQINVDTFSDGAGYFVRTEIETRSVSIRGPLPDLETAQKLKADQLANRENVADTLRRSLSDAAAALPGGETS